MNLPVPQFRAQYRATGFPAGALATSGSLRFTADDLAHALFVTGRAPGHRASYGAASFWELLHRTSLIPAYVRMGGGGQLVRSRLAVELDRSEKVALSYALGQAMTGVFCENLLGVTHLMHVERYANRFGVQFGPTRQRPDLFGPSPAGWVVAEAKGRSNRMESALAGKLRAQKSSIRSIGGAPPGIALGCVASFPPDTGAMRIDAFDPKEIEPVAVDLNIDFDRYFLAYYEPFVEAIDQGEDPVRDDWSTSVRFGQVGLRVGLDSRLLGVIREAPDRQQSGLAERVQQILARVDEVDVERRYPDGSIVETEWDESLHVDDVEKG